jgi:tetratricopeptide (TPR) repeat protein
MQGSLLLALLDREEGNLLKAITTLQQALEAHPVAEFVEGRMLLVELYGATEQFTELVTVLEPVVKNYPAAAKPRGIRANCLLRLGRLEEAQREFEELLERHPENNVALVNLGCIYFVLKNFVKSEELYSRQLAVDAEDFKALCNRAHARIKQGAYEAALEDYITLRNGFPGSVTQSMLDALRDTPEYIASAVSIHSLLFARVMSYESWMQDVSKHL